MSVGRAQTEVSSAEYVNWIAYSRLTAGPKAASAKPKKKRMSDEQMANVFGLYRQAHITTHPDLYREQAV